MILIRLSYPSFEQNFYISYAIKKWEAKDASHFTIFAIAASNQETPRFIEDGTLQDFQGFYGKI